MPKHPLVEEPFPDIQPKPALTLLELFEFPYLSSLLGLCWWSSADCSEVYTYVIKTLIQQGALSTLRYFIAVDFAGVKNSVNTEAFTGLY